MYVFYSSSRLFHNRLYTPKMATDVAINFDQQTNRCQNGDLSSLIPWARRAHHCAVTDNYAGKNYNTNSNASAPR